VEVNAVRLLTLASIGFAFMGLARPVAAAADDGHRHDQCQATAGSGYYGGSGEECPVPGVTVQPAPAAPSPRLPAPQSSAAPAVAATAPPISTPGPATTPAVPAAGTDLRPSVLGGAAIAGLAVLLLSGFRARRRLQRGWD